MAACVVTDAPELRAALAGHPQINVRDRDDDVPAETESHVGAARIVFNTDELELP
ncbi:hypothetical protein [Streptomyces sp. NPDC001530]|uniref:hypothetical protein n=1 Tax=Streptomyces sp. NPDC001530 TaxID=3364582 RepID=UPI0036B0E776